MNMKKFSPFVIGLALVAHASAARDETNLLPPAPQFAAPWLTFNTSVQASAGSPIAIEVADLDGDGDIDIVTPRGYVGGGGFSFLRNEGEGRFAQPVVYSGSTRAAGIAVGDVNGDGRPDVIVSDGDGLSFGNSLSLYFGSGNGNFGPRQALSLGTGTIAPIGIAAGDFDGDGDVDLAVACYWTGAVHLLQNNGNGTFAAPVVLPVGTKPGDIAAGDLNGDGRPDLVVAHEEYRLSVLLNNGSGGFAAALTYAGLNNGTNWAGSTFLPYLWAISIAMVNSTSSTATPAPGTGTRDTSSSCATTAAAG